MPRYKNAFDLVFLLPIPVHNIPPGGYDIVFVLADTARRSGLRTAIVFINSGNYRFWNAIQRVFGRNRITYFYRLLPFINRFRKVDYDFRILRGQNLYFLDDFSQVDFNARAVFATAWTTAAFASRFVESQNSRGYFLIQKFQRRRC